MSELNFNGFFDALQTEKELKILIEEKNQHDKLWEEYKLDINNYNKKLSTRLYTYLKNN